MFNFWKKNKSSGSINIKDSAGNQVKLALQSLFLTGNIYPFGARLFVYHLFEIKSKKSVECIYSFLLPKDGTLRKFLIKHNRKIIKSSLKPLDEAEEIYEDAFMKGDLALMSKQYRDGLVNLTIGNLKKNEPVIVILEILSGISIFENSYRFRFPFTIAPSYHRKAVYFEIDEGIGEIDLPEDIFNDIILPKFKKDGKGLHKINFSLNLYFPKDSIIDSPSHEINIAKKGEYFIVSQNKNSDIPNRDLMLNISCKFDSPKLWMGKDRENKNSFFFIIPKNEFKNKFSKENNLKVVFVLDKSASMNGEPIERAKNALIKCINNLEEQDEFGIITFADSSNILTPKLLKATMKNKKIAIRLLELDNNNGGTEILDALKEAISLLQDNGVIFLITDGQVWEGEEIINFDYKNIPIHCLGIGSASQDRFIANLTESTGGTYIFMSLNENIEEKALDLINLIKNSYIKNVYISVKNIKGEIQPDPPKNIYSSLVISGYFEEINNSSYIEVYWERNKRKFFKLLDYIQKSNGETLRVIRGSKIISSLENKIYNSKYKSMCKRKLIEMGYKFDISNSQLALITVIERYDNFKERELSETIVIPFEMPVGTRFESYFNYDFPCFLLRDSSTSNHNIHDKDLFYEEKKDLKLSPLLKKRIKDCFFKINFDIISNLKSEIINEEKTYLLKIFLLLSFFKIVYLVENDSKIENYIQMLKKYLKQVNFNKNYPELKKFLEDIDALISPKILTENQIENFLDLIENCFFSNISEVEVLYDEIVKIFDFLYRLNNLISLI